MHNNQHADSNYLQTGHVEPTIHVLPERRSSFQSPQTKPRKSPVGVLYAVGTMDNTKGKSDYYSISDCKKISYLL